MKLSKAAEMQFRMSHRGFQSLFHIRVRTVLLPPSSVTSVRTSSNEHRALHEAGERTFMA